MNSKTTIKHKIPIPTPNPIPMKFDCVGKEVGAAEIISVIIDFAGIDV